MQPRHRKAINITISPGELDFIDRVRGDVPRSRYLVAGAMALARAQGYEYTTLRALAPVPAPEVATHGNEE